MTDHERRDELREHGERRTSMKGGCDDKEQNMVRVPSVLATLNDLDVAMGYRQIYRERYIDK